MIGSPSGEFGRGLDALGVYVTGAASDGGALITAQQNLGGFRSALEAQAPGVRPVPPLDNIEAVRPIGAAGRGALVEAVSDDELRYTPPGGSAGAAVAVPDGTSRVLHGSDATAAALRVRRRDRARQGHLGGVVFAVDLLEVLGGALGFKDADQSAEDVYHGLMLRAHGRYGVRNIRIYVTPLGTPFTTATSQLPTAGGGTLVGPLGAASDWPAVGYYRVETSGGALREIGYYASRTDDIVTVSGNAHRGLLGSVRSAGAADDVVSPVGGIWVGIEAADPVDGSIGTIADENTLPAGVTGATTAITATTGVQAGNLPPGRNLGLWIKSERPAGMSASPGTGGGGTSHGITIEFESV